MMVDDDRLAQAWRAATARIADRPPCPGADDLAALVEGTLPDGAARDRLVDHLADCADCADEYRLLSGAEAVPLAARRSASAWWVAVGLAASLAGIALVLPASWWRLGGGDPGATATRSSAEAGIELIVPDGSRPFQGRFEWRPRAGATAYRLEVFTQAGDLVWSSRITETSVVAPPGTLPPRGSFFWQVTALDGERPIAGSAPIVFRIE